MHPLLPLNLVVQMSMREVKTDADELMDDAEFEVGDSAHKMRKVSIVLTFEAMSIDLTPPWQTQQLLRQFRELMETNTIGDNDEECPICMEKLETKHCKRSPAQTQVLLSQKC